MLEVGQEVVQAVDVVLGGSGQVVQGRLHLVMMLLLTMKMVMMMVVLMMTDVIYGDGGSMILSIKLSDDDYNGVYVDDDDSGT